MPLTPSIGVSVIIHLVVIVWYRIFNHVPVKVKKGARYMNGVVMRTVGYGVVCVVSIVILSGALTLVKTSVSEKHSSIYFVNGYVQRTKDYISHSASPTALAFPRQKP